jgi:hypothetical protein
MIVTEKAINLIEPIIDHSLSLLPSRTSRSDIAYGLLTALRSVRASLDELGGYDRVALLDGAIRDRMAIRRLREPGAHQNVTLPSPGPQDSVGETVMVAAVESCLVYAGQTGRFDGILRVVAILLDRLILVLGRVPDHIAVIDWLRFDPETQEEHPMRLPREALPALH